MKSALEELTEVLAGIGMNDHEINTLLGKFHEEEAYDYVECMYLIKEKLAENITYN